MKVAIITGISGQDGAYLAQLLLSKGYKVIGVVRDLNRKLTGLEYLGIHNDVTLELCDLWEQASILRLLAKHRPDEIYNLAAQSSVGLSFEYPIETIKFNFVSVLNFLEAIRLYDNKIRFYQASSSEMYGSVAKLPVAVNSPMHPLSPYAISKASAFWMIVNYREAYKLQCCTGVLFNHESYLRSSNFFVKKVIVEAIKMTTDPDMVLRLGNLNVKRDFGYSPKYVEAMWMMLQKSVAKDYIICSGTSVLLADVVRHVFNNLGVDTSRIVIDEDLNRLTDIEDIYGDNSEATNDLGWDYNLNFYQVLDMLIEEELRNSVVRYPLSKLPVL
ncbi:GDP-mannose 4,6-dehydratase [Dyadobacter beijingensis]|uniref:GDP-mannose 4,6-dehydratase n=1 Tax=Dyadobacter beijingensis TaxID=365489 RepID=A0ABQ2HZX8_9BACT|nr:GDP-mannose 4,6-dehydratase [Dyadobacter beijingensis]GGM96503.1 GDP-mannose 4,6-dehydratase [Dyadobacter beijingensis]